MTWIQTKVRCPVNNQLALYGISMGAMVAENQSDQFSLGQRLRDFRTISNPFGFRNISVSVIFS